MSDKWSWVGGILGVLNLAIALVFYFTGEYARATLHTVLGIWMFQPVARNV